VVMRFIPKAGSGKWSIEHYQVIKGNRGRPEACGMDSAPPGMYTALVHKHDGINMIDSPVLIQDQQEVIADASGHIVVCGLGLGVVVGFLVDMDDVEKITVIENDQDVINLVWHAYSMNNKCSIRFADAKTMSAQQMDLLGKIDRVWLDLWNTDEATTVPERWSVYQKWSTVCEWVGVSAFRRKAEQWGQ